MFGNALLPRPALRRRPAAGFTLVELLTVIVIIAILAAITLNIAKLVGDKKTETMCRGQMLLITEKLEQFKNDNGDYPPMDNSDGNGSPYSERNLLMALTGHARWYSNPQGQRIWETVAMSRKFDDGAIVTNGFGEVYNWGHEYLETAKFTYDKDESTPSNFSNLAVLYDPWFDGVQGHNAYLYRYKSIADAINPTPATSIWQAKLYLLVSRGPDGLPEDPDSNFIWKTINGHTQYSGFLVDDYSDAGAHQNLNDNIVMGADTFPPE